MSDGAEILNWIDALPAAAKEAVLARMKPVRVKAGTLVYERYAPVKGLYLIHSGKVRLFSLSLDGRELTFKIYGPNESFGDVAAIDGNPYPLSADAETDCTMSFLSRAHLTELRAEYREIETALLELTVRIARTTVMFIEEATLLPLNARIASRLSFLAAGAKERGESVSELKIAQKDIGVMVGASRQAVNKVLSEFQALNLIETSYGLVRIKDAKGLLDQSMRFSPVTQNDL